MTVSNIYLFKLGPAVPLKLSNKLSSALKTCMCAHVCLLQVSNR